MATGKDINILIVDDDHHSLKITRIALGYLGYKNVTTCEDAEKAFNLLVSGSFDLVICDWCMPKMSGLDLFNTIKAQPNLENIPFIMSTSMSDKSRIIEAAKTGIKHYIVKPLDRETLQAKINLCMGTTSEKK
jgi:two-component system chemotaxis response regulator CheY